MDNSGTNPQAGNGNSSPQSTANTKLIVVIILLIFVYPAGVVMMWQWMRYWVWWLKLLITIPLIALIIGGALFLVMMLKDPNQILEEGSASSSHIVAEEFVNATERYVINKNELPCNFPSLAPGRPLSELSACIDELVTGEELDPTFKSKTGLAVINVHYDTVERTLFACIDNGCVSKVVASSEFMDPNINLQLPTPTPSGPPPLFP